MMRFLVADDSRWKIDFLSVLIARAGLAEGLLIAHTTEEAMDIIDDQDEISFAFIDYEIPSANGPAVIARLRERHPACRIALVTSSASASYRKDATDAGADACITMSVPQDEAESALTDLLTEWKAERA